MPKLKSDEHTHKCEHEEHAEHRRQPYYIVRKYYNELENHFCAGCLEMMARQGHVSWTKDGYIPITSSIETLLNIYGVKGYYQIKKEN